MPPTMPSPGPYASEQQGVIPVYLLVPDGGGRLPSGSFVVPQLPPAVAECTLDVTLPQWSRFNQFFRLSSYGSLRRLTAEALLFAPSDMCSQCGPGPVILDCGQTLRHLVFLDIQSPPVVYVEIDALALFSALAHMPRLENLSLTYMHLIHYDVDLPPPPFRLRHYKFRCSGVRRGRKDDIGDKGWTWPISTSAQTLHRLRIGLRSANDLQELFSLPNMHRLQSLSISGFTGPGDIDGYSRFIAQRSAHLRCLSLIGLHVLGIRNDIQLLSAPGARPLASIAVSLSLTLQPEPRAELDAALAHELCTAQSLRRLRTCVIHDALSQGMKPFPLVRAVCATRKILFLLNPSYSRSQFYE